MSLQIRPLSYALGAEIAGIDIRQRLDAKSLSGVHTAFLEYGVLLFRGQPLTREEHIAFGRQFGELDAQDAAGKYYPDYPEIELPKPAPAKKTKPSDYDGLQWHTDKIQRCEPPMASLLRGAEIPGI